MKRIRAVLEYDGSAYHGFQIQKNAVTIQEKIETSIENLIGEKAGIMAAGRTDAGVHAVGQVIAFDTNSSIPPEKWKFALNSILPDDIRIVSSCEATADFHPRFDAVDKRYIYLIHRKPSGKVFFGKYAYCNPEALQVELMQQGCRMLLGRHNFKSFCSSGSSVKTHERHVKECKLLEKGPFLRLDITADGFLYNMVRIIVGTLLDVGRLTYEPEHISDIILARDRTRAGQTAPPQGLYLYSVNYG
ncbi:trna pseudouridine synthase a [hydrocarbon metagenome]|uniref:Trna pseudouridine synthase a n=1 Tax=hydrocarbon metagenome TaxID=938273 RepID=A0A0W8E6V9_9ZZZZ